MFKYNDILRKAVGKTFLEWKEILSDDARTFEIVDCLDNVPQGTFYHPEYNALYHVYLVFTALVEIKRFDLLEAALLHDVGKGWTTTIGRDRIYHFGHDVESAKFVEANRDFVMDFDLTYPIVRDHMKYKWNSEKLIKECLFDLNDFIYCDKILSKRIYMQRSNFVGRFINRLKEKYQYYKGRNSKRVLYVSVGCSGSGKSTYLRKNFEDKFIISSDEIRKELNGDISDQSNAKEVWRTVYNRAYDSLLTNGIAVLDATNVFRFRRVRDMAQFNGFRKVALVFDVDVETAIERVANDIEVGKDRSNVPEKAIRKMHKEFNRGLNSLEHEFHEVIYVS